MPEEATTNQSAAGKGIAQAKEGSNANVNTNAPVFNINIVPTTSSYQTSIAGHPKAEEADSSGPLPLIWNVPHQRNPFFTGRMDVLSQLHETLVTGKTAALTQPQALS